MKEGGLVSSLEGSSFMRTSPLCPERGVNGKLRSEVFSILSISRLPRNLEEVLASRALSVREKYLGGGSLDEFLLPLGRGFLLLAFLLLLLNAVDPSAALTSLLLLLHDPVYVCIHSPQHPATLNI